MDKIMDDVLKSIQFFSKQCLQAWEETRKLPLNTSEIDRLAIAGMGASAYGYYALRALFDDQLNVPVVLINDYHLPKFCNDKTLVIIMSFSGNTQECLTILEKALEKGCQTLIISSGGKLQDLAREKKLNNYLFKNLWNPSNQPRLACGYTLFSLFGILQNLGIINLPEDEVNKALSFVETQFGELEDNPKVKDLLQKITDRQLLLLAGEHLSANVHIFRNQLNETSKIFATYALLPEANHHLLEGLSHPKTNPQTLHIVSFHSQFYTPKLNKRLVLTEKISIQNGINFSIIEAKGKNKLEEILWLILFSSYVSYKLALINGEDPKKIEWVDLFKKELAAQNG